MTDRTSQTIGQLVAERPERSRVFERLGIDYCCGGRKLLADACVQRGLDIDDVLSQLAAADAGSPAGAEPDWTKAPLSRLADHIESTHHERMRRELPRVAALVQRVSGVHGRAHPELAALNRTFAEFSSELLSHMHREEAVLFPWIRVALDRDHGARTSGPLDPPIRRMMQEHDHAGRALATMRELTNGFNPPPEACGTYRVMLSGLRDIEADMHVHVHKENNILFPRALALEASGSGAA